MTDSLPVYDVTVCEGFPALPLFVCATFQNL